eukprot:gene377-690_t
MDMFRKVFNKVKVLCGTKYLMAYFIGLTSILVNLVPVLNGKDLLYEELTKDTAPIIIALKSKVTNDILVAGITVTWPVILDIVFGQLYKSKPIKAPIYFSIDWIVLLLPMFLMLFLFVIPYEQYNWCPLIFSSQVTFGFCCCMYYLHVNSPKIFKWHRLCLLCLLRLGQGVFRSYSSFYYITLTTNLIVTKVLSSVVGLVLLILFLQWAYSLYKNRIDWYNLSDQEIYSISSTMFVIAFVIFFAISGQSDGSSFLRKDTKEVSTHLAFFVAIPAIQYVLHVRTTRQLIVTSQDVSDPMKKVLHNLKLFADDMEMRTDVAWDELLAVDGMRDTCISAVSALENLITFDKLENGILDPVMVSMNAWSFLRDIARPFRVQRSPEGIRLDVSFPTEVVEWLEEYCVYVDKESMCQAFRAVVKNARNTTPPGGTVCITARRLQENEVKTSRALHLLATAERGRQIEKNNSSSNDDSKSRVLPEIPVFITDMLRIEVKDCGPGISMSSSITYLNLNRVVVGDRTLDQIGGLGVWASTSRMPVPCMKSPQLKEESRSIRSVLYDNRDRVTFADQSESVRYLDNIIVGLSTDSFSNGVTSNSNNSTSNTGLSTILVMSSHERSIIDMEEGKRDDMTTYDVTNQTENDTAFGFEVIMKHNTTGINSNTGPMLGESNENANEETELLVQDFISTWKDCDVRTSMAESIDIDEVSDFDPATIITTTTTTTGIAVLRSSKRKLRVLVVDDEGTDGETLARVLRWRCDPCHSVSALSEAVEKVTAAIANQLTYDLVLIRVGGDGDMSAGLTIRSAGYLGLLVGMTGDQSVLTKELELVSSNELDLIVSKPVDMELMDEFLSENLPNPKGIYGL